MRRDLTSGHLPAHHRDATASHRPPSTAAFLALGPFGEALPLAARALQATSPDTFGPPVSWSPSATADRHSAKRTPGVEGPMLPRTFGHRQNATGAPELGTTGSDSRRMACLSAHPVPVPAAGGEPNHADAKTYIILWVRGRATLHIDTQRDVLVH